MPNLPDEYTQYLGRRARKCNLHAPLSRAEFETLLQRLDDLYLMDIEGHLDVEMRARLDELAALLDEGPSLSPKARDAAGCDCWERTLPLHSRLGQPRPSATKRRSHWRNRRPRAGNG